MRSFLVALQFLTRIPVDGLAASDEEYGHSVAYYPLIGLLLGGFLAALAKLLPESHVMLSAAVLLAIFVLSTGGLHLDGLADCADAWVGGYGSRERSMQIMKDPACGPIAVTVLILVLLLKWSAFMVMLEQHRIAPLVIAPLLGRTAILVLMLSTPYVRPKGLAEALFSYFPERLAWWVCVVALVVSSGVLGIPTVLLSGFLLFWIRQAAITRLGGATGDVYGASVELIETCVLLMAALS